MIDLIDFVNFAFLHSVPNPSWRRNLAPGHFGFYRTSEEALYVGFVVQLVDVFGGWLLVAGENDLWFHYHPGKPWLAVISLLEMTDGIVFVAVDDETAHGGDREKGEHVAAGESGREGLFGVDAVGTAEEFRSGSRLQALSASRKVPLVVARKVFITESSLATFPGESRFVFAHGNLSMVKPLESKRIMFLES